MGRKSTIDRLPKDVREQAREQLGDGGPTLSEVRDHIAAAGAEPPTISALHRERQKILKWAERARQAREIADVWASELGSNPESKAGKMLQETLRLLAFHAADEMAEQRDAGEPIDVKAFSALARSFLAIENGARISQERERELIAEGERRAAGKAEKTARSMGMTADQAKQLRLQLGGAGAA